MTPPSTALRTALSVLGALLLGVSLLAYEASTPPLARLLDANVDDPRSHPDSSRSLAQSVLDHVLFRGLTG